MLNNVGHDNAAQPAVNKSELKEIENIQPGLALQCNKIKDCEDTFVPSMYIVRITVQQDSQYVSETLECRLHPTLNEIKADHRSVSLAILDYNKDKFLPLLSTACKTLGTHILPMVAYDIEEQLKYITKIISYQFTITDPNNIVHPKHDAFKLTVTIHVSPVV